MMYDGSMLAAAPLAPPLWFLGGLLLILGASTAMFVLLVRRSTTRRPWLALGDWAEANGFILRAAPRASGPGILEALGVGRPKVLICLNDTDTWLVQIEASLRAEGQISSRWNLLIRRITGEWPTTGLRPAAHGRSILDFFSLSDMQAMSPSERFTLYGEQATAARAVASSALRGLLPPDIGLVLLDHYLMLDFSARPFDPLELERLDDLAEQLTVHLPRL